MLNLIQNIYKIGRNSTSSLPNSSSHLPTLDIQAFCNMSSALPFVSRVVGNHAREILARDRARAQKLLSGSHPHGPIGIRELRARRHGHHHHHGGSGGGGSTGGGSTGGGSAGGGGAPTDSGAGVDVTDAGVTYTASVGVGSPATQYTLLIDTGASHISGRCHSVNLRFVD